MIWVAAFAAVSLAAGVAFAQSDQQVTFGTQWWKENNPEAKYEEYRDFARGPTVETFLIRQLQDRWSAVLWGRNPLLNDKDVGLSVSRGVSWRFDGRFQGIPHRFSEVSRSPYTEVTTGVFRLPDSLQRVNQEFSSKYAQTMQDLLSVAPLTPLGTQTSLSQMRLRSRPAPGWRVELRGSDRDREGHQAYAGTFGFSNAVELAIPISQRTQTAEAIASYERGRVLVQATGGFSKFTDNAATLIWDNPKRYTDGGTSQTGALQGRMALPPDNNLVRGQVEMGVRLPMAGRLSADVGLSQGTQNDPFIPYTINSALPQSSLDSLPARSLNGKATTLSQDYRLSGAPFSGLYVNVRYHDEEYKNKTSQLEFHGLSPYDYTWSADTTMQDLLGWKHSTAGVDVDVDPLSWAGASVTYERQHRDHNDREVLADHEDVVAASLHLKPLDGTDVSGSIRHGDRKQNDFDATAYDGADPATLRRYDVANRREDLSQVQIVQELGPAFDLAGTFADSKDDYPDTQVGLLSTSQQTITIDATWHVRKNLDADGGFGHNVLKSHQHGIDGVSGGWFAHLRDRTPFAYFKGTWKPLPAKLTLIGSYTYTWDMVDYHLIGFDKFSAADTTPGNRNGTVAQDPPNTFYRLQQLLMEGRWSGWKDTDVALRYGFDQYDVEDFSVGGILQLLGLTTSRTGTTYSSSATAVFLGDELTPYRAHRLALLVSRRF